MGRQRNRPEDEVQFVEESELPKVGQGKMWTSRLAILVKHPKRWARIAEYDNPDQTYQAQSNLQGRRVVIPFPDHNWQFMARKCELYARYNGPYREPVKRPRRSTKTTRKKKVT